MENKLGEESVEILKDLLLREYKRIEIYRMQLRIALTQLGDDTLQINEDED